MCINIGFAFIPVYLRNRNYLDFVGFSALRYDATAMNGQLSERPLTEILQELSARSQTGRLRIEHGRIKIAAYFYQGKFVYAACNLRDLRLRNYLLRGGLLTLQQLDIFAEDLSDVELAESIATKQLLPLVTLEQIHTRQVSDILRFALSLKEGAWEFDSRSRLDVAVTLNLDLEAILTGAARRTAAPAAPEVSDAESVETFLQRLRAADSFYDVLGVETAASADQLKSAYYELARRYHPDRFRKTEPALLSRLESAFAKITQAYDTLRDDRLRATYDTKLQARKKAPQLVDSAPKQAAVDTPAPAAPIADTTAPADAPLSAAERAANDFKEGYAALEQGERKLAAGLFASAARLMPNEARYRAYYGHMLASQENTRRTAEAELQAAIKLDPKNADYRVMLGQLFRDLGFVIRARGEAERALGVDPNNRKARELLRELKGV